MIGVFCASSWLGCCCCWVCCYFGLQFWWLGWLFIFLRGMVSFGYLGWRLLFVAVVVWDDWGCLVRWWRSNPDDDKRTTEWNGIIRRLLADLRIGCVRRWWRLVLNVILGWYTASHRAAAANGECSIWWGVYLLRWWWVRTVGWVFVDGELFWWGILRTCDDVDLIIIGWWYYGNFCCCYRELNNIGMILSSLFFV